MKKTREEQLAYQRAWYIKNKEKSSAKRKAYRIDHREEIAVQSRAYYVANKEKVTAQHKEYSSAHKKELGAYRKAYHLEHRDKLIARARSHALLHPERAHSNLLLRKYGLSKSAFDDLLLKQNGVCAICGKPDWRKKRPYVDHDHITGRVRGILCSHCNTALGMIGDDSKIAHAMGDYLDY